MTADPVLVAAAPGTLALRRRVETPPTGGCLVTVEPLVVVGWSWDEAATAWPLVLGAHLRSSPTPTRTDPADLVAVLHAAHAAPPAMTAGVLEYAADRLALGMAFTGAREIDAAGHLLTLAALVAVGGREPAEVMDAPCGPRPEADPCAACEVLATLAAGERSA